MRKQCACTWTCTFTIGMFHSFLSDPVLQLLLILIVQRDTQSLLILVIKWETAAVGTLAAFPKR